MCCFIAYLVIRPGKCVLVVTKKSVAYIIHTEMLTVVQAIVTSRSHSHTPSYAQNQLLLTPC